MRIIDKIDLTVQPKSCTEHPLVKLKKIIDQLNINEAIEVLTDSNVIPVETLRVIAKRKNIELKIIEQNDSIYRVLMIRAK